MSEMFVSSKLGLSSVRGSVIVAARLMVKRPRLRSNSTAEASPASSPMADAGNRGLMSLLRGLSDIINKRDKGGGMKDEVKKIRSYFILHPSSLIPAFSPVAVVRAVRG